MVKLTWLLNLTLACVSFIGGMNAKHIKRVNNLKRINHGHDVHIEEYPFIVNIWRSHLYHCGGTLVTSKCVLTAAHCLQDIEDINELHIFGTLNANPIRAFEGRVSKIIVPNNYSRNNSRFCDDSNCHRRSFQEFEGPFNNIQTTTPSLNQQLDIGIIVLNNRLPRRQVVTVQIDHHEVQPGANVTILGWSPASHAISPTENLKAFHSKVYDDFLCKFFWRDEVNVVNEFCIAENNEQRPCDRDIGGPAVHNGKQVGIISNVNPCAHRPVPSVYTRLSNKEAQIFLRRTLDANC